MLHQWFSYTQRCKYVICSSVTTVTRGLFCFQRVWIRFRLVANGDEIQVARHSSQVRYVPGRRRQVYRSWTRIHQSWQIQRGCAHVSLVKWCNCQWSEVLWILVPFKNVDNYGVVWARKRPDLVAVFSRRMMSWNEKIVWKLFTLSCKVTWQLAKNMNTIRNPVDYQETDYESPISATLM